MDIAALGYQIDSSQAALAAKDLKAMALASIEAEKGAQALKSRVDALGAAKFFTSGDLAKASQGLQRFNQSAASASVGATSIGRASTAAAKGGNDLAHSMTNVSFQVQDFAVQLASGQSAMMAFAQQFPQLTGALGFAGKAGLYGALIGTAAAVGVTLYQAFGSATTNAKSLDDVVGDLDKSFAALSEYMRVSTMDTAALRDEFGLFAGEVRGFNEYMQGIAIAESLEKSDEVIAKLRAGLDEVSVAYQNVKMAQAALNEAETGGFATDEQILTARDALALYQDELSTLSGNLGLSADQAMQLRDGLNSVASANSLGQQSTEAAKVLKFIEGIYGNSTKLPAPLRATYTELVNIASKAAKANEEIDKLPGALGSAVTAANKLAGEVGNIAGAAARSQTAIENMTNALRTAAGLAVFGPDTVPQVPSGLGNFGLNPLGQGLAPGTSPRPPRRPTLQNDPNWGWLDKEKGGGGGGGKSAAEELAEDMEKRFETLQKGLASEYVLKMQEYAKDGEAMKWALNNKKISQAQYNDEMEQLRIATWGAEWELTSLKYQQDQEALQSALDNKLLTEEEYYRKRKELAWANLLSEDNRSDLAKDLENTSQYFGQLYSMTGSSLDGLLKLQRGFSAAMALINAWQGYTSVLADPTVSFWMKFAAAGKVLAAGLGAVNAIKGGGGGSGGATGATSATSTATASQPDRVTRVELIGDDFLTALVRERLGPLLYEYTKDGGRIMVA